jgi:hypothetical protein
LLFFFFFQSPGAHAFTGSYDIFGHAGHSYSALDVGRNKDDRFEVSVTFFLFFLPSYVCFFFQVFMIDAADGSVWHSWQTSRALHANLGWHPTAERLGALTGARSLCVISNQDGRLEVRELPFSLFCFLQCFPFSLSLSLFRCLQ